MVVGRISLGVAGPFVGCKDGLICPQTNLLEWVFMFKPPHLYDLPNITQSIVLWMSSAYISMMNEACVSE